MRRAWISLRQRSKQRSTTQLLKLSIRSTWDKIASARRRIAIEPRRTSKWRSKFWIPKDQPSRKTFQKMTFWIPTLVLMTLTIQLLAKQQGMITRFTSHREVELVLKWRHSSMTWWPKSQRMYQTRRHKFVPSIHQSARNQSLLSLK